MAGQPAEQSFMCGIAGLVATDRKTPDRAILDRLSAALAHRGPDGAGRHVGPGVGLVHRRLAVIDLETGQQPLKSDGGMFLVANAEIYNHVELRRELETAARFRTKSDCEVIPHLYRREGIDGFKRLRGMYAFALYDTTTGDLVLGRDPYGIKPLYYTTLSNGLAFASEAQALAAAGLVSGATLERRVEELLQLGFTTGSETIFAGVHRVLPGELITIRGGRILSRRRMPGLPSGAPVPITEREAVDAVDRALADSVSVHERSDVPYGLFLSGGIDSRSILACMARSGERSVLAYTASFPQAAERDEAPAAARAAQLFGAKHVRVEVTEQAFWSALPEAINHMDDPVTDPAAVPTFILAREAAKDVKVVLCGDGGDEFFAGYSRYRRQARPRWLGGRVRRRTGPFSANGVLRREPQAWRDGIIGAERDSREPGRTRLQVAQAVDCVDFLPHYLLAKLDRSLMANGVEGRTPFLDPVVARTGLLVPDSLKLRRGVGKYIVRRWLADQAPQDDCFNRKKGFTPPYLEWLRTAGAQLGPLVESDPAIQEICLPGGVAPLFVSADRQALEAAWRLLFFALWRRRHVDGQNLEGGVFECLSPAAHASAHGRPAQVARAKTLLDEVVGA
jgi:asparagine synthase (glutamine-hydrolysing)